jgi:hypothetical protein
MGERVQVDTHIDLEKADGAMPDASLEKLSRSSAPDPTSAHSVTIDTPLNVDTDLDQLRGMPVRIHTVDRDDPDDRFAAMATDPVQIVEVEGSGESTIVHYQKLGVAKQEPVEPGAMRMPLTGGSQGPVDGSIKSEYRQITEIETCCMQNVLLFTEDAVTRQMRDDRVHTRSVAISDEKDRREAIQRSYGPGSQLHVELTDGKTESITYLGLNETPAGDAIVVEQGGERKLMMIEDINRMRPEKYYPGGKPEQTGFVIPFVPQ